MPDTVNREILPDLNIIINIGDFTMVCQYLVIFLGTLFLVERNIGVVYQTAKAANIKRAPIFPGLQYLDHHYKTKCETSMDAPLKNFN